MNFQLVIVLVAGVIVVIVVGIKLETLVNLWAIDYADQNTL